LIIPFIRRRWWFFQQRFVSTISLGMILPIVLYFLIVNPFSKIFVNHYDSVPFEEWAFPGMLILIGIVSIIPILYRDLFDYRIHKKAILSMTLAPISKLKLLSGFLISAILESLFFVCVGGAMYSILTGIVFAPVDYGIILGFILVINVLAGCFVTSVALLFSRVFSFFFVLIVFLLYLIFGTGMIFSIDFFPENFGMILKYVPFGLLIQELQQTLFYGEFHWLPISSLVLLIVPWIYINSEFLRRKLNQ
tara:strand:- start:72 stop:821 length:750 start_codon:yes stop_codon:yes gene_type:complete